jgi:predicted dehydrogenase
MQTMQKIRIGVIGCGDIAQIMHLPYLTDLRELYEVPVVCDIVPDVAETVANAFKVPDRCNDYLEVIARSDLDAVAVLTQDHAQVAMAAARAGKHIFVEKPMVYTVEEGRALQEEVEANGVVLMVAYMKRYDPGYELARGLIREMKDVRLIRVHDFAGMLIPDDIYTLYRSTSITPEERSRRQSEVQAKLAAGLGTNQPDLVNAYGLMLGLASHDMTVLRGIFGDPVQVCHAEVFAGGKMIFALLEYPGETRCAWEIGSVQHSTGRWFDEEFSVYSGAQVLTLQFPNPYVRYLPTSVRVRGLEETHYTEKIITASYDEAFRREWRHFYECVTSDIPPRTGVADGLQDVELLRDIVRKAAG